MEMGRPPRLTCRSGTLSELVRSATCRVDTVQILSGRLRAAGWVSRRRAGEFVHLSPCGRGRTRSVRVKGAGRPRHVLPHPSPRRCAASLSNKALVSTQPADERFSLAPLTRPSLRADLSRKGRGVIAASTAHRRESTPLPLRERVAAQRRGEGFGPSRPSRRYQCQQGERGDTRRCVLEAAPRSTVLCAGRALPTNPTITQTLLERWLSRSAKRVRLTEFRLRGVARLRSRSGPR